MNRLWYQAMTAMAFAVLGVVSLNMHASTLVPVRSGHTSHVTSHGASSTTCFTVCTTATINKDEIIENDEDEEDDIPHPPIYFETQLARIASISAWHHQEAKLALLQKPPPNATPLYITLGVFRA